MTAPTGSRFERWRPVAAWVALALAALVVLVSSLTVWVRQQALDTDAWTEASGQLLEEPEVRTAVATYLVDELFANVDVPAVLARALPDRLDPLAGVAAATLRGAAVNQAQSLLASPRVQEVWERANRFAHERFIALVDEEDTGRPLTTSNGDVVLDLRPLLDGLRQQVGLSSERLPRLSGQVVLLRADQMQNARTAVRGIRVLSVALSLLAVALFAAAIWLGEGRRRRIVAAGGVSLLVIALILALVRRLGGDYVVDTLATTDTVRPAAAAAWSIGTTLMRDVALGLVVYGVVILVGVWLSGTSRPAVAVRRMLAPVLRSHPWIVFAAVVALLLVLLLAGPGSNVRTSLGLVVLGAGMIAGVEVLRRQVLREFPRDAAAG